MPHLLEKGLAIHTRGQAPLAELPLGLPGLGCVLPTGSPVRQRGAQKPLPAARLQGCGRENQAVIPRAVLSSSVHWPGPSFHFKEGRKPRRKVSGEDNTDP